VTDDPGEDLRKAFAAVCHARSLHPELDDYAWRRFNPSSAWIWARIDAIIFRFLPDETAASAERGYQAIVAGEMRPEESGPYLAALAAGFKLACGYGDRWTNSDEGQAALEVIEALTAPFADAESDDENGAEDGSAAEPEWEVEV